jgi:TonB family protein
MRCATNKTTARSVQWLISGLALGLPIVLAATVLTSCSKPPTSNVPNSQQRGEAESSTISAAKEGSRTVRPCGQELLSKGEGLSGKPEYRMRNGETYRGAPEFSFEVGEAGEVTKVKIVRSSGVWSVDKLVMDNIRNWKYGPSPGCQPVEVTATVSINWSD